MDKVWASKWKKFFIQYPKSRKPITDLIKSGYHPNGKDGKIAATDEELAEGFADKTVEWTLHRSSDQLFLMSEIIAMTPALKPQGFDVFTPFLQDFIAIIAVATEAYLHQRLNRLSYEAVLKVHSIDRPSSWLQLSRKDSKRVDGIVASGKMCRPIYPWQKPDRWAECLDVEDTKRFISFMHIAWEENLSVPYLCEKFQKGMSVNLAGPTPHFREFDINIELAKMFPKIKQMKRPVMLFNET